MVSGITKYFRLVFGKLAGWSCSRLYLALLCSVAVALYFWSSTLARAAWQENTGSLPPDLSIPNPPIATRSTVVDWPVPRLRHELPELKKLDLSANQSALPAILERVGENVAALFRNLPNTTCREEVTEERLSRDGIANDSLFQDFHYLVLGSSEAGRPSFREYRTDAKGEQVNPKGLDRGFVLTQGFASMAIHFHPRYQSESRFRYLGTETMDKHETDVVAFAQKPSAQEKGAFVLSDRIATILLQGVAWIDRSNHEIIRMRTDLERPALEVGLERETTQVKFGEVHFKGVATAMWLPEDVSVDVELVRQGFRNMHHYSDFRLFSVETGQKPAAPN